MAYIRIILFLFFASLISGFYDYCKHELKDDIYSFSCDESEAGSSSILKNQSYKSNYYFEVKLKGSNSLQLIIINDLLNQINLNSLDISRNENNLESFMTKINTLITLKVLNLSHNQISILKTNQFNNLYQLKQLDLSHNQIFYFELNSFKGLENLIHFTVANAEQA